MRFARKCQFLAAFPKFDRQSDPISYKTSIEDRVRTPPLQLSESYSAWSGCFSKRSQRKTHAFLTRHRELYAGKHPARIHSVELEENNSW
jgi:hypothetical protein